MRYLFTVFCALLISSCNTNQTADLNKQIDNLRIDSIKLSSQNKLLVFKIDSIQNCAKRLDSLQRIFNSSKNCVCGKSLIIFAHAAKQYYDGTINIITVKDYYDNAYNALQDARKTISPQLYTEAKEFIDAFADKGDINPGIQSMSTTLWLAVYKEQAKRISAKFCKQ